MKNGSKAMEKIGYMRKIIIHWEMKACMRCRWLRERERREREREEGMGQGRRRREEEGEGDDGQKRLFEIWMKREKKHN